MTTTAAKTATIVFEVGETYTCSWPCASHLTTPQTVIARTAKFVTIRDDDTGEECRVGVKVSTCGEPYEYVCPFGTYSMCAVMSADQKVETVPEPSIWPRDGPTATPGKTAPRRAATRSAASVTAANTARVATTRSPGPSATTDIRSAEKSGLGVATPDRSCLH